MRERGGVRVRKAKPGSVQRTVCTEPPSCRSRGACPSGPAPYGLLFFRTRRRRRYEFLIGFSLGRLDITSATMGGGPSSGLEFGQLSHLAIAQRATGPDACECLCGAIEIRQRHVLLQFPCVTKTKPLSRPRREFDAAGFEELWTLFYASQSNSIEICGRVRVRARVQCSQGHRQYDREKNDKHSVVPHSLLSDGFGRAAARSA